MSKRLLNKVAIITGGARGIGKATAQKMLEEGAHIAIWDVDQRAGKKSVSTWTDAGYNCRFYKVNTVDFDTVMKATKQVMEDFGQIDILINNAGITRDASMKKMTHEQWQQVLDVNLTGVFNCTKAVSPLMVEQCSGRIINASSIVGIKGNFGQTNYVASKAGIIGMTKTWAKEFGRYNVTVNAIAPGFIETEMVQTIPQHLKDIMVANTPLGRMGSVDDIANGYVFLASEEASFITGIVLNINGGLG